MGAAKKSLTKSSILQWLVTIKERKRLKFSLLFFSLHSFNLFDLHFEDISEESSAGKSRRRARNGKVSALNCVGIGMSFTTKKLWQFQLF